MIGDSYEADILGALQTGMYAIHFAPEGAESHNDCLVIDDLRKLNDIL